MSGAIHPDELTEEERHYSALECAWGCRFCAREKAAGELEAERDSLRAQVEALTKERDDARVEAEHWKTVAGREAYLKAALDRSTAERAALRAALEKVVEEDAEEKSMGLYDAVHAALSLDTSPGVRFLVAARRFFDSVGGFRGESAEFEIALNARRAELIE